MTQPVQASALLHLADAWYTLNAKKGAALDDRAFEAALFSILPLLREVAPKKLAAILESRIELRSIAARYAEGPGGLRFDASEIDVQNIGSESGPATGETAAVALTQQRQLEVLRLLGDGKTDEGHEVARSIPSAGVRAQTIAAVAFDFGDSPRGRSVLKAVLEALDSIRGDPSVCSRDG